MYSCKIILFIALLGLVASGSFGLECYECTDCDTIDKETPTVDGCQYCVATADKNGPASRSCLKDKPDFDVGLQTCQTAVNEKGRTITKCVCEKDLCNIGYVCHDEAWRDFESLFASASALVLSDDAANTDLFELLGKEKDFKFEDLISDPRKFVSKIYNKICDAKIEKLLQDMKSAAEGSSYSKVVKSLQKALQSLQIKVCLKAEFERTMNQILSGSTYEEIVRKTQEEYKRLLKLTALLKDLWQSESMKTLRSAPEKYFDLGKNSAMKHYKATYAQIEKNMESLKKVYKSLESLSDTKRFQSLIADLKHEVGEYTKLNDKFAKGIKPKIDAVIENVKRVYKNLGKSLENPLSELMHKGFDSFAEYFDRVSSADGTYKSLMKSVQENKLNLNVSKGMLDDFLKSADFAAFVNELADLDNKLPSIKSEAIQHQYELLSLELVMLKNAVNNLHAVAISKDFDNVLYTIASQKNLLKDIMNANFDEVVKGFDDLIRYYQDIARDAKAVLRSKHMEKIIALINEGLPKDPRSQKPPIDVKMLADTIDTGVANYVRDLRKMQSELRDQKDKGFKNILDQIDNVDTLIPKLNDTETIRRNIYSEMNGTFSVSQVRRSVYKEMFDWLNRMVKEYEKNQRNFLNQTKEFLKFGFFKQFEGMIEQFTKNTPGGRKRRSVDTRILPESCTFSRHNLLVAPGQKCEGYTCLAMQRVRAAAGVAVPSLLVTLFVAIVALMK